MNQFKAYKLYKNTHENAMVKLSDARVKVAEMRAADEAAAREYVKYLDSDMLLDNARIRALGEKVLAAARDYRKALEELGAAEFNCTKAFVEAQEAGVCAARR